MVTVVVVWPGPMGNRASTPYLPRLAASNQSFKVPGTNDKWTADSNNNNIEILIKFKVSDDILFCLCVILVVGGHNISIVNSRTLLLFWDDER